MKPFLPPLLLGLALSGTATGLILHRLSPAVDPSAIHASQPAPSPIPAWSWRDSPVPRPLGAATPPPAPTARGHTRAPPRGPPAPPATHPAPSPIPAGAGRDPPVPRPPGADSVGAAITAWRNLRSPDGSPVSAATRSQALLALLVRLAPADFPRLLAALPPPDTAPNRRLLRLAFECWVNVDAPAATRWAVAAGSAYKELTRLAIRAWAALDPSAASAWVCALPPDAQSRHEIRSELVAALGSEDPAKLVQTLGTELLKHGASLWAINEPLRAWLTRDPAAALAWFAQQPSLSRWSRAQDMAMLVGSPETARTLGAIVAATADYPDQAAILAQLVLRMGPGKSSDTLAWLTQHTSPELRDEVLLSLGSTYYLAPEIALALPPGRIRSQALGRMLTDWSRKDAPAALAWANEHAADPGVVAATAQVQAAQLAEIATAEPATALAEWSTLSDPRMKKASLTPIAEAWGQTDPAAALRWQTEQSAALGIQNSSTSSYLVSMWAKKDSEAALRWTENYLATTSTEQTPWLPQKLLGALAGSWDEKAPFAPTADLFAKIQDPALRSETLTKHVAEWLTKDPAAAKAWLESHDALTPAQAAALLEAR